MKISIALCTYNGSKYLSAQLDSFLAQTRLPDELIVCDDCSTDNTLEITNNHRVKAPFPVRVFRNPENLGSTKNFEKAIHLCSGDIIALSDQDDVWLPEKLAKIEAAFHHSPKVGMVFSDAEVVDEYLRPLGFTLWSSVGFTSRLRKKFKNNPFGCLLKSYLVTGATMAFRSRYRSLVIPFAMSYWIHDGWIALLISAVAPVSFLEERLVLYRQHHANQLGAQRDSLQKRLIKARQWGAKEIYAKVKALICAAVRLRQYTETVQDQNMSNYLELYVRHLLARRKVIRRGYAGIPIALNQLISGKYHVYSNGTKSFVSDCLRGLKKQVNM